MSITGLICAVLITCTGLLACAGTPENLQPFEDPGVSGQWTFVELEGVTRLEGLELNLGSEGRASGSTGLNHFSGTVTLEGNKLSFGPLVTTRRAGPEEDMVRETHFLRALDSVDGWKAEGSIVALTARNQVVARLAKK